MIVDKKEDKFQESQRNVIKQVLISWIFSKWTLFFGFITIMSFYALLIRKKIDSNEILYKNSHQFVYANNSGVIEHLAFQQGDLVKRGQLIAVIAVSDTKEEHKPADSYHIKALLEKGIIK